MSVSQQDELTFPVVNRLSRFYTSDSLYAMMCHPLTLNWSGLMRDKKIILVTLKDDQGITPPSERQLLGALMVSQIENAARRIASDKLDFRLYIDEAQRFVSTSLDKMFEEIRKFGVWVTVANQYLEQLAGKTLTSMMGNTASTFIFEVGVDDSRELAHYVSPVFTREDLLALGYYRAVVKTSLNGVAEPAFKIETLPKPEASPDAIEREARIRQRSIEQYTPESTDRVLQWLKNRYKDDDDIFMPNPGADKAKSEDTDNDDNQDPWAA